jgi:hypothetical protein
MYDDDPFTLDEDAIFASFRDARLVAPREWLAAGGYVPVAPEGMPAGHLPGRMWELLYALAARRFFFCGAEALEDGALYAAVFAWLDRPQRDIPWDQGWNCLHDFVSGSETWSNPWFDEESHGAWRREVACVILPAATCEGQGARMLPVPPTPPVVLVNSTAGIPEEWLTGDADKDPLGLAPAAEPPPVIREPWEQPAAQLQRTGYTPVPPDELTDDATPPRLWEFLHQLAIRSFFVTSTDHLSDAGLYRELWRKAIRDDALIPGRRTAAGYWMHDILGSYGDEEIQIQLAVYATDEERARHVREYPNIPVPERKGRAARRDWRLPKPPF